MLTPAEASAALRTANASQARSITMYRYRSCAPYFFVWGLAWIAGYGACALRPERFDLFMPIALWSAILVSLAFSLRAGKEARQDSWRAAGGFLVMWIFTYGLFSILPPNPRVIAAYFPLLFAALYAGIGLWVGARYVLVGAFVAAAALLGYFLAGDYFYVWMAAAGGGSLILTGFWLRQA
jgi:hypothetical protein